MEDYEPQALAKLELERGEKLKVARLYARRATRVPDARAGVRCSSACCC
ncbi:hypothetical protein [Corallococcus sp. AB030]